MRAKYRARSRRAAGAAFAWISNDAEVWRTIRVSRPVAIPLAATHAVTSSVTACSACRAVAITSSVAACRMARACPKPPAKARPAAMTASSSIGAERLERRKVRGVEFLGSEVAILCGAMSWVSERHLVAAIANAGGFGLIAGGAMTPELLDAEIAGTKALTIKPFGVNLITMHPQLFDLIAVCAKHGMTHVVLAGGLPPKGSLEAIKDTGAKVICFAPALSLAKKLIRSGVDALVVEGMEAGGHIGPVSTSVLAQEILPEVAEQVPVFVAGGIGRGEAIAGALCHVWIDGQLIRYDDDWWLIRCTPRKARSKWSENNRTRATELLAEKRVAKAGLAEIEAAKADGRWDAAYASASTIAVPDDLAAALDAEPEARAFFDTLTGANRYAILYREHAAKTPATRAARIARFAAMCARGETVH